MMPSSGTGDLLYHVPHPPRRCSGLSSDSSSGNEVTDPLLGMGSGSFPKKDCNETRLGVPDIRRPRLLSRFSDDIEASLSGNDLCPNFKFDTSVIQVNMKAEEVGSLAEVKLVQRPGFQADKFFDEMEPILNVMRYSRPSIIGTPTVAENSFQLSIRTIYCIKIKLCTVLYKT